MSIFDSIMGDITPFADALNSTLQSAGSVTGNRGNSSQDAQTNQEYRSLRLESMINNNKLSQPYGPQSFQAGKSQEAPTANSEAINQQWLQRLNRYSSMPQFEGARAKGN